jgi:hypothetical protein
VSVAERLGAALSPQLTATTIAFPAVLPALNAAAMEVLAASFVTPAVCTKLMAACASWLESEMRTATARERPTFIR